MGYASFAVDSSLNCWIFIQALRAVLTRSLALRKSSKAESRYQSFCSNPADIIRMVTTFRRLDSAMLLLTMYTECFPEIDFVLLILYYLIYPQACDLWLFYIVCVHVLMFLFIFLGSFFYFRFFCCCSNCCLSFCRDSAAIWEGETKILLLQLSVTYVTIERTI